MGGRCHSHAVSEYEMDFEKQIKSDRTTHRHAPDIFKNTQYFKISLNQINLGSFQHFYPRTTKALVVLGLP